MDTLEIGVAFTQDELYEKTTVIWLNDKSRGA